MPCIAAPMSSHALVALIALMPSPILQRPHTGRRAVLRLGMVSEANFGFDECADTAALRRRFRVLAAEYHPDSPTGDGDTFRRLVSAYEGKLKKSRSLFKFDKELEEAFAELALVLAALAQKTIERAVGSDTYKQVTDTVNAGWTYVTGVQQALLPEAKRKSLGRRVVSFVGNAFSKVTRRKRASSDESSDDYQI